MTFNSSVLHSSTSTINLAVFIPLVIVSSTLTHDDAVICSPVLSLISPTWVDHVACQRSSVACELVQTGTDAVCLLTALDDMSTHATATTLNRPRPHVNTRHGHYPQQT